MSWTLSAYTIALAAALVPGRSDGGSVRTPPVSSPLGLVGFTLASALCAIAPSAALLVAFRVVQALGAAALVPAGLALVLSVFPRERVPVAVAVWGSISALAAAVGPTAGALLVDRLGVARGLPGEPADRDHRPGAEPALPAGVAGVRAGSVPRSVGRRTARRLDDPGRARHRAERPVALGLGPHDRCDRARPARPRVVHPADAAGAAPGPGPHPLRRSVVPVGQHRHRRVHGRVHRDVLRLDPVHHPGLGLLDRPGGPRDDARPARRRRAGAADGRARGPRGATGAAGAGRPHLGGVGRLAAAGHGHRAPLGAAPRCPPPCSVASASPSSSRSWSAPRCRACPRTPTASDPR